MQKKLATFCQKTSVVKNDKDDFFTRFPGALETPLRKTWVMVKADYRVEPDNNTAAKNDDDTFCVTKKAHRKTDTPFFIC